MNNAQDTFYDLIQDFNHAMLISQDNESLHARPMAVANIDPEAHKIWFATSRDTDKVEEILSNPHVNVAFQGKTSFASVKGSAVLNREQDKIDALWNESWRTWFPEGKEASNIVLIEVDAEHGEFWDASGTKGLSMLVDTATAYINGETPKERDERHDTVALKNSTK